MALGNDPGCLARRSANSRRPQREATPSAASIDSQTVKTTERAASGATMAARRSGAASGISCVDTLGLLLAVVVTSAAVDDAAAAPHVLRATDAARLSATGGGVGRRQVPQLRLVRLESHDNDSAVDNWKSSVVRATRKASSSCQNAGSPNGPWPGSAAHAA